MAVVMPAMVPAQEQGWLALLQISERMPSGWALVGGQLTHLHCAERGVTPPRPTTDLDAVMDVRQHPNSLMDFTTVLVDLGFESDGVSPEGFQHRFKRGDALIDVLIPRHLGERAEMRPGATGSPTIPAPGSQQALHRTERVEVDVAGTVGSVLRPNLLGALVAKASTTQIIIDKNPTRHIEDFCVLASMLSASDLRAEMDKLDLDRLGNMVARAIDSGLIEQTPGADRGINMLRVALRLRPNGSGSSSDDSPVA